MRFDDSLRTVLAIDTGTAFGAAAAWRQLVDLIGRGRVPASDEAIARLRAIRGLVPATVRAASARALAFAAPGAELVALFAGEDLAVAAPVLRTARLDADQWVALLPRLSPPLRAVLRHRRDLPDEVGRALEQFGAADFVLPFDGEAAWAEAASAEPAAPAPAEPAASLPAVPPVAVPAPVPVAPFDETPFVAVGAIARELPVVAEARRQAVAAPARGSDIADLVARIDAFTSRRGTPANETGAEPTPAPATADRFTFETDAAGVIRWAEGVSRAPVIGLSIADGRGARAADGVAAGAFRHRTAFRDARLEVGGSGAAAGSWRISAVPQFDPASGRFTGYRGTARRPRAEESAGPRSPAADSLRQLVHELRTPTNAISGFAELIESELLGPVPAPYRARAGAIRGEAAGLVTAIDDLDTAARIEGGALELRAGPVPLAPLLARTAADLAPLADLRGARLSVAPVPADLAIDVDDRAADRLFGRLFAALVALAGRGERLSVVTLAEPDGRVLLVADRPAALAALAADGLLSIDAEREAEAPGAPLLGTGFALRLAQNLARELGGALAIEPDRLTLRLPAAMPEAVGQASTR